MRRLLDETPEETLNRQVRHDIHVMTQRCHKHSEGFGKVRFALRGFGCETKLWFLKWYDCQNSSITLWKPWASTALMLRPNEWIREMTQVAADLNLVCREVRSPACSNDVVPRYPVTLAITLFVGDRDWVDSLVSGLTQEEIHQPVTPYEGEMEREFTPIYF